MEIQKPKIVDKVWGHEEWIVNEQLYCGKKFLLLKGKRCSLHCHKNKDETFYVQQGRVLMEVDGEEKVMTQGESVRILPNVLHRFSGLEKSVIFEFSAHHDDEDSYRVEGELSGDVSKEIMEEYK